ncbi:MAG TPA: filamentous hemagglutinin N-terminal domain-containing protein, partial [Spongiibacteraceae bacterium]
MDPLTGLARPLRRRKKFYCTRWTFASLLSAPLWAFTPIGAAAGPAGGHIVGGNGSISRPNNDLTEIHQRSDRLAIDWQQFDVNANEVVRFIQPSSRSIALNRILDSKQSLILGRIEANGKIFLINPRGIIFGKDATINVAGLVASSLDIDPRNFIKGNFVFKDGGTFTANGGDGVIVNQGTIEAAVGGAVVLLGKVVINEGDIRTPHGSVRLVSAGGAVISFDDNNQLGIQITAQQKEKIDNQTDAVRNGGTISAEGGLIALTGATTADLFTNAVNNEGVLVANSVRNHNGVIELTGDESHVAQSGEINVSAIDKAGGVDINSGGKINISGNAIHDTGKLIADGANGGDIQLHANDLVVTQNDATISATGNNGKGGHIELLADRVGVLDNSRIDASGSAGGGVVHVGGAFHGERHDGSPRNAQRTVLDKNAAIYADATTNGSGGEVVLWSDDITYFAGNIFARGGNNGGDGGNLEVSGKNALNFFGHVDTSAPHGKMGNLLLDPAIINIINGSGGAQDAGVADGIILSGDSPSPYQISEQALEALTSNVTLTATQQINIANLADNELLFNPNGGTVTFNINGSGNTSFTMADVNDTIRVNNGNLVINSNNTGGNVNFTLGNLTTTTAGNITVTASAPCTASFSSCNGGAITINSGAINSAGSVTVHADSTGQNSSFFFGNASGGNISINVGDIAVGGAVAIDAVSNATGGIFFGTLSSGTTSVTVGNIVESGHNDILVAASSPLNHSLENVFIGGNYLTDGTGGNISISGNTLHLNSDTLLEDAVFAAGGTMAVTFNTLTANGHQLVQGYNNIYVGDISGSATTFGDFGFSQANIDAFTGAGLMLRAKNNVFLGNTTLTSASATSVQLVADRDNSGGGDLSIASGKTFDANGRNFIGSGANATINGSIVNSGTGSQQFNTTSAINFGSGATLTSASGNIALTAGTSIAMASNATITSTTGQLALTAANNIALGSLTTGNTTTSAVNVTSTAGAISNAGAATNISANAAGSRVALHAASGIAANLSINDLVLTNSSSGTVSLTNDRALQISSFTNTPATTSSVTTTGVGSNMTIAGNVSSGSNLTLTSSGTFTVVNGNTVNSNAGTLSINATGDAAITGLTTTNNTASAISVISGGAISDNGNTNVDISATQANAVVTLQAANGIGAGNALDLAIARLALTNSTAGAVSLTNNRALQINSLTNTPATTTTIITTGVGSNMAIAGNVASGSDIALTSSGTFSITDGFTVNSNAGTLAINSIGNAAITGLTTTNNTASAISVISGGAISDNGNTNLDISATQPNAVVTLQAASGIGAANALDLAIANLILTNSTSGAVNITNNRALHINAFTNTPATAASIATTGIGSDLTLGGNVSSGSNLTLTSSGAFTVVDGFTVNSNAGTLAINATGDAAITGLTTTNNTVSAISVISGGAISDNGDTSLDITATQANALVTLQATNGIGIANAIDLAIAKLALVNSTAGAVNVTNNRALQINSLTNTPATTTTVTTIGVGSNMTIAGNVASGSDIALISSGTFSVTDGFTVNSNAGTLSINATGNAAITGLTATNNTASAISVISGAAISDNGDINADITATQPSAVVALQAVSGIGTGNAIDINVANITASNGSSGDIRLHALGSF